MQDDAAFDLGDEHSYKSLLSLAKSWSKDSVLAAAELARHAHGLTDSFEDCIYRSRFPAF